MDVLKLSVWMVLMNLGNLASNVKGIIVGTYTALALENSNTRQVEMFYACLLFYIPIFSNKSNFYSKLEIFFFLIKENSSTRRF